MLKTKLEMFSFLAFFLREWKHFHPWYKKAFIEPSLS